MSSELEANMRRTSEALVMAFDGEWTTEAALAPRAENCEHIMLPNSLGIPKKSNSEWAARFEHVKHLITDAKMTIDEYVGIPDQRRSVVRSSLLANTPVGPFKNEYVWLLTFDESGQKIIQITEFMDTQAALGLRSRLAEAKIANRV